MQSNFEPDRSRNKIWTSSDSMSVCLCLSVCVCLCLSVCVCVGVCICICLSAARWLQFVSVCLHLCLSVCVSVCVRVSVVDCGDKASDWLRSFLNVENIRLVRHHVPDTLTETHLNAGTQLNAAQLNTAQSLFCYY